MKRSFKGKHGPLLIAEIGGNHEGDFEYAKKLTRLAIDSDVDFIKFQIYKAETLVSELENPDRHEHFKKFELSEQQYLELAQMVKNAGVGFTSSVWDLDALSWIDEYIPVYKIGSGDLTAYPLLKNIALRGKPIILSTGLSTEKEVLDSVKYIQAVNQVYNEKENLVLLQCTSMYPIQHEDVHLSVMDRYRELTGLTVGYSDHTVGIKALLYATAMGAEILEFHFTDSRKGKTFRDHKVSLTPGEVKKLINEIDIIESLKGNSEKKQLQIEKENNHHVSFRRAVYPSRDIGKGETLNEKNLTVLRPNHGIDARDFNKVKGKKAAAQLKKHQKLSWNLLN